MVATASRSGNAMHTQKSHELTQQSRDAKIAMVNLTMSKNKKCMNLEEWRQALDTALGLLNAHIYLNESMNIHIDDESEIFRAQAEIHKRSMTTNLFMIDLTNDEPTEDIRTETKVKTEKVDNDEDEEETVEEKELEEGLKELNQPEVASKPAQAGESAQNFLNQLIAKNMESISACSQAETKTNVCYVNGLLCVHAWRVDESRAYFEKMNIDIYGCMKKMESGEYELHFAPLEDFFETRKRTVIFNMIVDSLKGIESYLYNHVLFGDISSLVLWVTETYGVSRKADRIRAHHENFLHLTSGETTENFELWLAKTLGYLSNDISLGIATPPIFVKLQLQKAVESGGSDELKSSWRDTENEYILSQKYTDKTDEYITISDLKTFLEGIKTRVHTYSAQTKSSRSQHGQNNHNQNQRNPRVNKTNYQNPNYQNQSSNNHKYTNTNTNTNANAYAKKICAYHNMIYGCKQTDCKYEHVTLVDDNERAKLIALATKGSRCGNCGLNGHEGKSCKKVEEMRKILSDRKKEDKRIRKTRQKKEKEVSCEEDEDDEDDDDDDE
jgi:hypothetical protein